MPRSSSTFTSEASLKRGGGCVKCCSFSSFSSSSLFTWSRLGSLWADSSSSSFFSSKTSYTFRNPSNRTTDPLTRKS